MGQGRGTGRGGGRGPGRGGGPFAAGPGGESVHQVWYAYGTDTVKVNYALLRTLGVSGSGRTPAIINAS